MLFQTETTMNKLYQNKGVYSMVDEIQIENTLPLKTKKLQETALASNNDQLPSDLIKKYNDQKIR